ncbi:hypothetical protein JL720_11300 [Aureococcus anophagefferens]|nr:hypothetical protein JL720_11300 [Aureococcus anophagefferens]
MSGFISYERDFDALKLLVDAAKNAGVPQEVAKLYDYIVKKTTVKKYASTDYRKSLKAFISKRFVPKDPDAPPAGARIVEDLSTATPGALTYPSRHTLRAGRMSNAVARTPLEEEELTPQHTFVVEFYPGYRNKVKHPAWGPSGAGDGYQVKVQRKGHDHWVDATDVDAINNASERAVAGFGSRSSPRSRGDMAAVSPPLTRPAGALTTAPTLDDDAADALSVESSAKSDAAEPPQDGEGDARNPSPLSAIDAMAALVAGGVSLTRPGPWSSS